MDGDWNYHSKPELAESLQKRHDMKWSPTKWSTILLLGSIMVAELTTHLHRPHRAIDHAIGCYELCDEQVEKEDHDQDLGVSGPNAPVHVIGQFTPVFLINQTIAFHHWIVHLGVGTWWHCDTHVKYNKLGMVCRKHQETCSLLTNSSIPVECSSKHPKMQG